MYSTLFPIQTIENGLYYDSWIYKDDHDHNSGGTSIFFREIIRLNHGPLIEAIEPPSEVPF